MFAWSHDRDFFDVNKSPAPEGEVILVLHDDNCQKLQVPYYYFK